MGKTAIVFDDLPYVFGAFCAKIEINEKMRCFISTYFRSKWFKNYIDNETVGTSINNIGNEQLLGIKLPIPPVSIVLEFEKRINPMFDFQGKIVKENQQLASLQDFLLPMLMNRQVKVVS